MSNRRWCESTRQLMWHAACNFVTLFYRPTTAGVAQSSIPAALMQPGTAGATQNVQRTVCRLRRCCSCRGVLHIYSIAVHALLRQTTCENAMNANAEQNTSLSYWLHQDQGTPSVSAPAPASLPVLPSLLAAAVLALLVVLAAARLALVLAAAAVPLLPLIP